MDLDQEYLMQILTYTIQLGKIDTKEQLIMLQLIKVGIMILQELLRFTQVLS
jgi:hypothetical protein